MGTDEGVEEGQAFTTEYKSVMPNRWSSLVSVLFRLLPAAKEKTQKTLKHECQWACAGNGGTFTCAMAAGLGLVTRLGYAWKDKLNRLSIIIEGQNLNPEGIGWSILFTCPIFLLWGQSSKFVMSSNVLSWVFLEDSEKMVFWCLLENTLGQHIYNYIRRFYLEQCVMQL